MPILGSSPLGLVLDSSDNTRSKIGEYVLSSSDENGNKFYTSLFGRDGDTTSTSEFNFIPDDSTLYDISTQEIIDYCKEHPMMKLSYADFAYLKDLGVYPNNRLIIARRFAAPVDDDLINNDNQVTPLATLISWVPDNAEFFDVSFGEEWTNAEVSIKNLLNEASTNRDLLAGDNAGAPLGTFLSEGAAAVPLPGWSEGLQYQVFRELGLTERQASDLPFGNPNLIRAAKRRTTAGKDESFEGFTTTISVKMTVVYEQKFISGVDPTGVYYDIISNVLNFGSSESKFMFNEEALGANNKFAEFINKLGSGDKEKVFDALVQFADALGSALIKVASEIVKALTKLAKDTKKAFDESENVVSGTVNAVDVVAKSLFGLLTKIIAGVVSKYKVRIVGILDALTGSPSTPWHVTIGNPKRPVFSSGDMITDNISVKFGKVLAFNDLPSSVTIDFTLKNARALGAQEIYRKLNCGKKRTYKRIRLDLLSENDDNLKSRIKEIDNLSEVLKKAEDEADVELRREEASGGSSNQGAPLENTGQSRANTPNNTNNPRNNSVVNTIEASYECVKNYNFIIDEIISIMNLRDSYGLSGKPIFRAFKGIWNDKEEKAVNALKQEIIGKSLKANVDAVGKCNEVKSKLDSALSKIYAATLSTNKPSFAQVDYFDLSASSARTRTSFNAEKKSINCDF